MSEKLEFVGLDPVAIAEIIRLNERRTAGQWTVRAEIVSVHISDWIAPIACDSLKNAEFIAACTWAVPALLEEVQRLRKALALSESSRASAQEYMESEPDRNRPRGVSWRKTLAFDIRFLCREIEDLRERLGAHPTNLTLQGHLQYLTGQLCMAVLGNINMIYDALNADPTLGDPNG